MTMTLGFAPSAARAGASRLSSAHTAAAPRARAHRFGSEQRVIFIGLQGGVSLAALPDSFSSIFQIGRAVDKVGVFAGTTEGDWAGVRPSPLHLTRIFGDADCKLRQERHEWGFWPPPTSGSGRAKAD